MKDQVGAFGTSAEPRVWYQLRCNQLPWQKMSRRCQQEIQKRNQRRNQKRNQEKNQKRSQHRTYLTYSMTKSGCGH
ncbi:MAG: hypothetical protein C5B49_15290 [Bdellovibrio sp.]|nr:MAG: hypothetical protein C5B49_15290 [Bdellovibrio sp.]